MYVRLPLALAALALLGGCSDDEEASFETLSSRPRDIVFAPRF